MAFVTALLLVASATAQAEESWLGKSVFWKPGARATLNQSDVDIATIPFPANVLEENGELLRLGQAWVRKSDVMSQKDAMEFFSEMIRKEPANPKWWSRRGLVWPGGIARTDDNFHNAMRDHAEAIRLAPADAACRFNRGKTLWERNGWDQAIEDFTEAIRLDPKHVESYRMRATGWSFKRQPDKAIADLTEVLRLKPNDAAAHYHRGQDWSIKRGMVFRSSEETECRQKAIQDFTAAIRLDPKYVSAYESRAYAWASDPHRSIADISECIKLQPDNYRFYEYRGYLWTAQGESDKAIGDYTAALKLHPQNSEAFHQRGELLSKRGEFDKAIQDFSEAIKIDLASGEASKAGFGRYGTAYNSRGVAWRKQGEFENAVQDFQEALKIAPADLRPLTNLAWLRATCPDERLRNGKEAIDSATKSLSSCRECSGFDTLAAAYAETGDFANAVKFAEKAVAAAPEIYKQPITERLILYRSKKPFREIPAERKE